VFIPMTWKIFSRNMPASTADKYMKQVVGAE
jgi:hypothetical protein